MDAETVAVTPLWRVAVLMTIATFALLAGPAIVAAPHGDDVAKEKSEKELHTEAKGMIMRYREAAMTKCGRDYYYAINENYSDDANSPNEFTVVTFEDDPGDTVGIVEVHLVGSDVLIDTDELDQTAKLNGYQWIGSAEYESGSIRLYPLKLSSTLSNYEYLSGEDLTGSRLDAYEDDQGEPSDASNNLNKWTAWGNLDPKSGYSPWGRVFFFKKNGKWYFGSPSAAYSEPVLMNNVIEANKDRTLKCADVPK